MAKKIIYLAAAGLLILAAVLAIVLGTYTEGYSLPQDYADNESMMRSVGSFIENDIIRYPAKANVSAFNVSDNKVKVGVAPETYELNFGNVPKTIIIRKFINLRNNEPTPVRVCFASRGDISPMISFTNGRDIVLMPGQAKEMEVLFNATDEGIYGGEVDIVVRKPKYDVSGYAIGLVKC